MILHKRESKITFVPQHNRILYCSLFTELFQDNPGEFLLVVDPNSAIGCVIDARRQFA